MSANLFGYLGSGHIVIGDYAVTLTPFTDGYELKVIHGTDEQVARLYGFDADGFAAIKQHVDRLDADLADAFDQTLAYNIGDYCMYDGSFYRCTDESPAGTPFSLTNWTQTTISNELGSASGLIDDGSTATDKTWSAFKEDTLINATQDMLSDKYNPGSAYEPGDYVINDNVLYKCTASTGGAWNPDKWTAVALSGELQNHQHLANEILGLKESISSLAATISKIVGIDFNAGTVTWNTDYYNYDGSMDMIPIE